MLNNVDLTPTWVDVLPLLIWAAGSTDEEVKCYAKDELMRMANLADRAARLISNKE